MSTPSFSVWDFSEKIEVRLNNEMIEKIRNCKIPKTTTHIHYRSQKPVTFTRNYWPFPIATAIGQRLFSKKEWRHGKIKPHEPFVTIAQLREVQRKTGISASELERAVTYVKSSCGTEVKLAMHFPIVADADWAALFGWWFAAGGKVTRNRGSSQERTLRFAVDARPFRELIIPVLRRVGYQNIPLELCEVYYVKRGGHKLDVHKFTEWGAVPRGFFFVHRPVREVMEKFGLPKPEQHLRSIDGIKGKRGFRQTCRDQVPKWITENPAFMHAFTEAYLNGPSAASQFHVQTWGKKLNQPLTRFVEPRFIGKDNQMVENFYSLIAEFLASEGIGGYKHKLPNKHKKTLSHELGYLIISNSDLIALNEKYRIMRSDARARLTIHCSMTLVLFELCRRLSGFEILLVGATLEMPYSINGFLEDFRCEKQALQSSLKRLSEMGVLTYEDGFYRFNPAAWIRDLKVEKDQLIEQYRGYCDSFLYQCSSCKTVFNQKVEQCLECGAKVYPISRRPILTPMNRRIKALQAVTAC